MDTGSQDPKKKRVRSAAWRQFWHTVATDFLKVEMSTNKRWLLFILIIGFLVFLGLVFWEFILTNLILPVAAVAWLFLRIFVLSISQQAYWELIIFGAVAFAIVRLFRGLNTTEVVRPRDINATLDTIRRWRNSIQANIMETGERHPLKRDLTWLLASTYLPGRQGSASYEIKEAMQQQEIPLPHSVYTFLFDYEPVEPRPPFTRHPIQFFAWILVRFRRAIKIWIRKRTGRQAAEYFQGIDEVLSLMEDSLEIRHDDDPSLTDNHD
jgi:hypothetical protein